MKNAVIRLFGNIGKIESSYTPQGKLITKASLAVNHGYGEKQVVNWYNLTAWGGNDDKKSNGEWMQETCQKGTHIMAEGVLILREYEKDGIKRISPDVTISEFRVLRNGKDKEESASLESDDDTPGYLE